MPIRWYGTGDPKDPTYRHFSRIVNLVLHAMAFAAVNSALWFFQNIHHSWPYLNWFTLTWLFGVLVNFFVVVRLRPATEDSSAKESSTGSEF